MDIIEKIIALGFDAVEVRPLTLGEAGRYAPGGAEYVTLKAAGGEAECLAAIMQFVSGKAGLVAFRSLPRFEGGWYYTRIAVLDWPRFALVGEAA